MGEFLGVGQSAVCYMENSQKRERGAVARLLDQLEAAAPSAPGGVERPAAGGEE